MIWQRYLLKDFFKIFALVLFGFFFLYCALDYSFHMQDFLKSKTIHFTDCLLYYTHVFIKRGDLLIPLAILLATIKVLTTLNAQRELLALQVAGLNLKKILLPVVWVASLTSLFNLLSYEFIFPRSAIYLDRFYEDHFSHSRNRKHALAPKEKLHIVPLTDRSKVVYQYFDQEKGAYFDLIWIRTPDDIWRIKYLKTDGKYPVGEFVDHFVRSKKGFFEKEASYPACTLTQLKWVRDSVAPCVPFENRQISELWKLKAKSTTTAYEKSEILTHLYYKLIMPFLSLLVVIAVAPFCLQYSRTRSPFFTYAFGLFGYVSVYLMINSTFILGETNVLDPSVAILGPFFLFAGIFSWKFFKTI